MADRPVAPPPSETIFQEALRSFRESLSNQQRQAFEATRFHDLQTFLAVLQAKQSSDRTLQSMRRLSAFLEAMDAYGRVLDTFVNVHNVVAFIWGPMKFLFEAARTHAGAFNGLLNAYKMIGESMPLLDQFQTLFGTHDHMKRILGELFRDIFEFHRRAMHFFQRPGWKLLFSALWKQFETNFGGIIEDVQQKRYLVESQASLVECKTAAEEREKRNRQVEQSLADEQRRRKQYIISWLAASEPRIDHERAQAARQSSPTSGRWLLRKARFRSWFDPHNSNDPLLWVTGKPGAGKSVLASLVIDEASMLRTSLTVYFYCRENDPDRNTFIAMARSMLRQLLVYDKSLCPVLFDAADSRCEQTLPVRSLAKELLNRCLRAVGPTYIVVDGLDECCEAEQQRIAEFLIQFVQDSGRDNMYSRCAFFSQNDQSTGRLLAKLPRITIEEADSRSDICKNCRTLADDIQGRFGREQKEAMDLANAVAYRSEGIFFFVKITMANLSLQTSQAALAAATQPQNIPKNLNEAYNRLMQRLWKRAPDPYRKDIIRLLTFLACAFRPVIWREVQGALAIEAWRDAMDLLPDQFDESLELRQHRLVVRAKELCGALVEFQDTTDGEVSLIHATFKEYLLRSGVVNPAAAHASLAELSISYLSMSPFDAAATDAEVESHIWKGDYVYTEYALAGWVKHLEAALRIDLHQLNPQQTAEAIKAKDQLAETLGTFFEQHWQDPRKTCKLQERYIGLPSVFNNTDIQKKLEQTMSSMQIFDSSYLPDTTPYETIDIFKTVARARLILERMVHDAPMRPSLEAYYGPFLFKCLRIGCKWYFEGFATLEEREAHMRRHERAFKCTHRGCPYSKLGFVTEDDLSRHNSIYNQAGPSENYFLSEQESEPDDTMDIFGRLATELQGVDQSPDQDPIVLGETRATGSDEQQDGPSDRTEVNTEFSNNQPSNRSRYRHRYKCNHCDRRFLCLKNLRSHRRIHTDETLSVCAICRILFTRVWNLIRPQRTGHCKEELA